MAVLLTEDRYSNASHWASSTNATWMAWVFPTDIGTTSGTSYKNVGGMLSEVMIDIHAQKWSIGTDTSDFDGPTTALVNTWAHVALVKEGNAKTLYLNGVLEASGSDTDAGTGLIIGNFENADNSDDWIGRIAAFKTFNTNLTVSQVQQEMRQYDPVHVASLNAYYPLLNTANDEVDFFTAGKTLTVGGTPANAEGPPIPWKRSRNRFASLAVTDSGGDGGGSSSISSGSNNISWMRRNRRRSA